MAKLVRNPPIDPMTPTPHAAAYGTLSPPLLEQMLRGHESYARGERGGQRAVFKFVQLSRINLSTRLLDDADFTAAAMAGAQLIRTSLRRASFFGADLTLADLRAADCRRADFRGAVLRGANLAQANLDEADLRRAILAVCQPGGGIRRWRPATTDPTRSSLRGSSLNGALIDDAQASETDFTNCSLKNARLNGANLKGAVFQNAILSGAEFKGANVADIDLRGAILTGVDLAQLQVPPEALAGCVCDPGPEAHARRPALAGRLNDAAAWVDSAGTRGAAPIFDDEDLRVLADAFRGRTLPALAGRRCQAVGMDFTKLQAPGALFDGADLRDTNFSGADLRGASFRGANLAFARFDGADLGPLELDRGTRMETVFDGANLTGARFTQSAADEAREAPRDRGAAA